MHVSGNQAMQVGAFPITITPSNTLEEFVLLTDTNLGSVDWEVLVPKGEFFTSGHNDSPIELCAIVINHLLQVPYIKDHEESKSVSMEVGVIDINL